MKTKRVWKVVECISLFIFICSVIVILLTEIEYRSGVAEYKRLEELAVRENFSMKQEVKSQKETDSSKKIIERNVNPINQTEDKKSLLLEREAKAVQIDSVKLKALNDEYCAYLFIPDTRISYPMVQGENNQYYLSYTFLKKKNGAGCIFIDKDCEKPFEGKQTIIYGHHMKNKTMFGSLGQYKEKNYWEKHPYIYVFHEESVNVYLIYSAYVQRADQQLKTDSDSLYLDKSLYQVEIPKELNRSKQITLITCDYSQTNARFIVHAGLIYQMQT